MLKLVVLFLFILSCGSEIDIQVFSGKDLAYPYFYPVQKLRKNTSEITSSWDRFGSRSAINEAQDLLVVGTRTDYVNVEEDGSIRLYKKESGEWVENSLFTLEGADIVSYKKYARSVVMSKVNNRIAVGVENLQNSSSFTTGGIYLYWDSGSGVELQQIIRAEHIVATDHIKFGGSVKFSYDGSILVVKAIQEDSDILTDAGTVYIYKFNEQTELYEEFQKIAAPSTSNSTTKFGSNIELSPSGKILFIAHSTANLTNTNEGIVYRYGLNKTSSSYELKEEIKSPVQQDDYLFGDNIKCMNECEIFAIRAENTTSTYDVGEVYIYILDSKSEIIQKILPYEYSTNGYTGFGTSMEFNPTGSLLAIGSMYRYSSRHTGKVYLYRLEDDQVKFHQEIKVNHIDAESTDSSTVFGNGITFSDNYLIVGAENISNTGIAVEGAAFIFESRDSSYAKNYGKTFLETFSRDDILLGFPLRDSLDDYLGNSIINSSSGISYGTNDDFEGVNFTNDSYAEYTGLNISGDYSVFLSFYNDSDETGKTLLSSEAFNLKTDSSDEDRLVLTLNRGTEEIIYTTDLFIFQVGRWHQIQINLKTDAAEVPELFVNGMKVILTASGDTSTKSLLTISTLTLGSQISSEAKSGSLNDFFILENQHNSIDPITFGALKY